VFCQVIAGELPSLELHDDEHTVAIMDQRQPGWPHVAHVLVHLLTRSRADGLLQIYGTPPELPPLEAMAPLATRLRQQLER